MTQPTIEEFYTDHQIDDDFDEIFYALEYPETDNFYQPYCVRNNIDDRHRLFYHWFLYGQINYQKNHKKLYFKPDEKLLDVSVSVVLGCKNREDMLNISIHSWIKYDPIKEIIITDWSSDNSIKYIEKISPKIKVIRVEGKKYYNASTPVNIAIKEAKHPLIMKLDVDYIINPYGNFNDLINVAEDEFISGNWRDDALDNNLGFVRGANGFLCTHKKNIEKVGYYDESIENYGFEDCNMFLSLIKTGLKRKTLKFETHNTPLYHNPHSSHYRVKEFKEKIISYNDRKYNGIPLIGPNFIIVGFQKSGTSALAHNLCANFPNQIYIPTITDPRTKKDTFELNFFLLHNRNSKNLDIDWYMSLFSSHVDKICGEKSPNYTINSEYSAREISKRYPAVKLIFMLRNPVTRAYSAYNHYTQMLPISNNFYRWVSEKSFIENIFDEATQSYNDKCSFLQQGLYADHIETYLKYFDMSQMLFVVQEKLAPSPSRLFSPFSAINSQNEWNRITSFLKISTDTTTNINNKTIHARKYKERMCSKSKELLQNYYKESNEKLFKLLGYRIKEWDD